MNKESVVEEAHSFPARLGCRVADVRLSGLIPIEQSRGRGTRNRMKELILRERKNLKPNTLNTLNVF